MKRIILIIIIVLLPFFSFAHPHIFIDSSIIFIIKNKEFKGMQITWIFDTIFSSSIIKEYDSNKDGFFSKKETFKVKDEAFSNLKKYNYFCFINLNGKKIKIECVKNFSINILKRKKLVYSFFIPISKKLQKQNGEIHFINYDKSFYCSITIKDKKSVSVKGLSSKNYIINFTKSHGEYNVLLKKIIIKYRGL